MKLNDLMLPISMVKRWLLSALLCTLAVALVWQGALIPNPPAMAAPVSAVMASVDAGDRVQAKTREDAGRAKNFIQDTKKQVERTANNNAKRVEQATDDQGGFFERRAKRDADRIEKRAEEDAARTQKAVDNTKNAVERAVDNIKDAFSE